MRQTSPSSPRRLAILLVAALMTALALPCFVTASAPAPTVDASFVASLTAPALQPASIFLQTSTGCTSNAQCPSGTLCCHACGYPGCTIKACLTPRNGHCPLIP